MEFVRCPEGYSVVGLTSAGVEAAWRLWREQQVVPVEEGCLLPQEWVMVPEFEIAKYPVTRREFLAWTKEAGAFLTPFAQAYWRSFESECVYSEEAPIVTATFMEACLFCYSHGGRLPYRTEWVRAVRGDSPMDGFREEAELVDSANWLPGWSPFDDPWSSMVNVRDGSKDSWCGACDLLGNADEFTLSPALGSKQMLAKAGRSHCERRISYMRCGIGAPIREAGYAHWIVPHLLSSVGEELRPRQIGFRVAKGVL